MENPFKQRTEMKSFLSQEVMTVAQDAARQLLADNDRGSIEVTVANSNFIVSKNPQKITIWQFEIDKQKFYLNIEQD